MCSEMEKYYYNPFVEIRCVYFGIFCVYFYNYNNLLKTSSKLAHIILKIDFKSIAQNVQAYPQKAAPVFFKSFLFNLKKIRIYLMFVMNKN